MQAAASALDAGSMTRVLLWLFFLADMAGIAWAVRVLARETRRHLAWHLGQRRARRVARQIETLELPEGFAIRPFTVFGVPQQREVGRSAAARPVSTAALLRRPETGTTLTGK